jgi:hypothetical protein
MSNTQIEPLLAWKTHANTGDDLAGTSVGIAFGDSGE